jgi:hypothetical protein
MQPLKHMECHEHLHTAGNAAAFVVIMVINNVLLA